MSRINQIGDTNLFVGTSQSVHVAKENGIEVIVNVANDLNDPHIDGLKYHKVGLHDGDNNDVYEYAAAAKIVLDALNHGKKVLLHCHEGRSRSAAVAIVALAILESKKPRFAPVCPSCGQGKHSDFMVITDSVYPHVGGYIGSAKKILFESRPLCEKMNEQHDKHLKGAVLFLNPGPASVVYPKNWDVIY